MGPFEIAPGPTGTAVRGRPQRRGRDMSSNTNRAVTYQGPGSGGPVETFRTRRSSCRTARVSTRRTSAARCRTARFSRSSPPTSAVRTSTWSAAAPRRREGLVLGHEITGEVVEVGPGVEFVKVGDICSVPFNIACGRCKNCKEGKTGICLNVNPDRPGSAYGYVDMGGWVGGQAEYVLVPYADWNLLVFPDRDQAHGEDHRPDDALGHLPHRIPRRVHGGHQARVHRLRRRRGSGRTCGRRLGAAARRRPSSSSATSTRNG